MNTPSSTPPPGLGYNKMPVKNTNMGPLFSAAVAKYNKTQTELFLLASQHGVKLNPGAARKLTENVLINNISAEKAFCLFLAEQKRSGRGCISQDMRVEIDRLLSSEYPELAKNPRVHHRIGKRVDEGMSVEKATNSYLAERKKCSMAKKPENTDTADAKSHELN
jgi:hypothetical protein